MKIHLACLPVSAFIATCLASCAAKPPAAPAAHAPVAEAPPPGAPSAPEQLPMSTWRETVAAALAKDDLRDRDYILDHMLAPQFVKKLVAKHGEAEWRRAFGEGRLAQLSYYLGHLKEADVETEGPRTTARGKYGCYAVFVEVDGRCLIADFGQEVSSM